MEHLKFVTINLPQSIEKPSPSQLSDYFRLTANPSTTLWRQPHSNTVATAPMVLTHLQHPFIVAEVTVMADFEMERDQCGLVIFSGPSPGISLSTSSQLRRRSCSRCESDNEGSNEQGKWVKAGLELIGDSLHATSAVATKESGADWSLCPLQPTPQFQPYETDGFSSTLRMNLRIKFERVGDSLEVWYRTDNSTHGTRAYYHPTPEIASQQWRKLREVMGFFSGIERKENVWVGCYASRPTGALQVDEEGYNGQEDESLIVEFEDLEIL